MADAVLGTASILRAEPTVKWVPPFDDFLALRLQYEHLRLKPNKVVNEEMESYKRKYPLQIVLSATGDISMKHPILNTPDLFVVLLTTKNGMTKLKSNGWKPEQKKLNLFVEVLGDGVNVDLKKAMKLVKTKYAVNFLDVSAGGKTIASLLQFKMVKKNKK